MKKLNRKQLRRLIESSFLGASAGSDYSTAQATKSLEMLDSMVAKLQTAMYGAGHDMSMIGKANKYLTGLGTEEEDIKNVFIEIVKFSNSKDAENLSKSPQGSGNDFLTTSGILKYIDSEFQKYNDISLGEALVDELDKEYLSELNVIIRGFLTHIS